MVLGSEPVPTWASTGEGLASLAVAGQAIATAIEHLAEARSGEQSESLLVLTVPARVMYMVWPGQRYVVAGPGGQGGMYTQFEFSGIGDQDAIRNLSRNKDGVPCDAIEMSINCQGERLATIRFEPYSKPTPLV